MSTRKRSIYELFDVSIPCGNLWFAGTETSPLSEVRARF